MLCLFLLMICYVDINVLFSRIISRESIHRAKKNFDHCLILTGNWRKTPIGTLLLFFSNLTNTVQINVFWILFELSNLLYRLLNFLICTRSDKNVFLIYYVNTILEMSLKKVLMSAGVKGPTLLQLNKSKICDHS